MDLATAASWFDQVLCVDAFSPYTSFYGQLDLFDDSRRDGPTVSRRILSVNPEVVIPARRVITMLGEQWLVGMHESDSFDGDVMRTKYVLHRADGAALIQDPSQAGSALGTQTYGARIWIKDLKELEVSSDFEGFFNVYLPRPEVVPVGSLIVLEDETFSVRNTYPSSAGFLVAESDRIEAAADATAAVSAVYTPRAYDPATDTNTAGAPVAIDLVIVRWQARFEQTSESAEKYRAGDLIGLAAKADLPTPQIGARVAFSGLVYEIISVENDNLLNWGLHLRPAAA